MDDRNSFLLDKGEEQKRERLNSLASFVLSLITLDLQHQVIHIQYTSSWEHKVFDILSDGKCDGSRVADYPLHFQFKRRVYRHWINPCRGRSKLLHRLSLGLKWRDLGVLWVRGVGKESFREERGGDRQLLHMHFPPWVLDCLHDFGKKVLTFQFKTLFPQFLDNTFGAENIPWFLGKTSLGMFLYATLYAVLLNV